jgi:hypothetical protein
MSTYEQLRGARLKFLDQDPANASNGQVWYNSTTGKDRVLGIGAAAWSSAPAMGTARKESIGFGTQTAGVFCGGVTPPFTTAVEEYNGTGFTAGTNMPANKGVGVGAGTATAGLVSNGEPPPSTSTFHYDGSAWTTHGAMPASRRFIMGFGLQTAAIGAGGMGTANSNNSYEYDGSTWTTLPNINTARRAGGGTGSTTAGIIYGGYTTTNVANSEEWNGSSWSEGNDLNTARQALYSFGTQTTAVAAGGNAPPYSTATENYDGSSWTTSPATMGTANASGGSAIQAPSTAGIAVGGNNPSINGTTQEYNFSTVTKNPSAWSAGTNWPGGAGMTFAGTGTQTAYLKSSGNDGTPPTNPISNNAYEFDGSSWTAASGVPYSSRDPDSAGLQTAAIQFGGQGPTAAVSTSVEYDGSSWTGAPSMNHSRRSVSGAGLQTTTITAGGAGPPGGSPEGAMTSTESYNGSTWSNEAALPAARFIGATVGSEPACLRVGGSPSAPVAEASVEYDGSTWTAGGNMNTPRGPNAIGASGTLTAGIIYGSPGTSCATEIYDGTSFITDATMANPTSYRGTKNSPASTGVMAVGGSGPAPKVEEYTAASPDTVNPAQNLTTST